MSNSRKEELLGLLSAAGGGGIAGLLDSAFPTTTFLKTTPGMWFTAATAIGGLAGAGTKYKGLAGYSGDSAKGGLGFYSGIGVVKLMLGQKADTTTATAQIPSGQTSGVAGLREHRPVTQADLHRGFAQVKSQVQEARRAA